MVLQTATTLSPYVLLCMHKTLSRVSTQLMEYPYCHVVSKEKRKKCAGDGALTCFCLRVSSYTLSPAPYLYLTFCYVCTARTFALVPSNWKLKYSNCLVCLKENEEIAAIVYDVVAITCSQ